MPEGVHPLDSISSIKVKLGLLVAVSVVLAVILGALGRFGGVPLLLLVPVAVALSLGVTQLLASGMTAPLREMTVVASQMARGDYGGRVITQSVDEVGRLAEAFNSMAADLAAVDAERRDLVATVSHELRTPLAALTAQLENLADGVVPADHEHLAEPLAQVNRLSTLVHDLLDLARHEVSDVELVREPIELAALVEECADEVRVAGRDREFVSEVPLDLVVQANPERLRQLLVNVFDNAARHCPPGTPVQVNAGRPGQDTSDWWLEVHDAGPGIAVADRERVFERWGTSDVGGGTGLGLAVARWVATLHGGSLHFLEPTASRPGARLRLDVPATPRQKISMTPPPASATPASSTPGPASDGIWAPFWPEPAGIGGTPAVAAAASVGVLAGTIMTFTRPGASWAIVLLLAGVAAFLTAARRRNGFTIVCATLSALLIVPMVLLDDVGVTVLCVLASAALFLVGVTGARTVTGFVLTGVAWPLSSLRGLPWFGRCLRLAGPIGRAPAVIRTAAISVVALGIFAALFASADALFASWVDALVPNLTFGSLVLRGFVAVAVFGVTLAAGYLALNPPRVDPQGAGPHPLTSRYEWLVPVVAIDVVFAAFLTSQAAATLGGHEFVERTTGVTYADYVHQGFGQLTVATALTLVVVAAAARWAGRSPTDQRWLRASLGVLCVLTLAVVASALYRMHVYQEAYGFTVLRLVVDVFEGWLGVLVIAVIVLGARGAGQRLLPRVGLIAGAVMLLGLAAVNPDAWVADRNIDRYEASGSIDLYYLQSLSADAAPVIERRLPADIARCALRNLPLNQLSDDVRDDALAWNLGRHRAASVVDRLAVTDVVDAESEASQACGELAAGLQTATDSSR